jgi:hypothetical protein
MATPSKKGKAPGSKNFISSEDITLTKSYRIVSSDASVGVDQDADTYYNKIAMEYAKLMGSSSVQERSAAALKARWLNVIQKALLKFVACLNKALSEYHSGWCMEDYITQAKQFYLTDVGKQFNFELCWMEVKNLPKFCIDTDSMSGDMKRALDLDEVEAAKSSTSSPKQSFRMAARPEIGKKQAKKLKFDQSENKQSSNSKAMLDRIATNGEVRAKNQRDHFKLKLFMLDRDSEEAQAFFKLKKAEALLEAKIEMLKKQKELQHLMGEGKEDETSEGKEGSDEERQ